MRQVLLLPIPRDGLRYLARVDLSTGAMTNIGEAFSNAGSIAVADNGVYFYCLYSQFAEFHLLIKWR